jgi:hypothetical protein
MKVGKIPPKKKKKPKKKRINKNLFIKKKVGCIHLKYDYLIGQ